MSNFFIGANGEDSRLTLAVSIWLRNNFSDSFYGHNPFWYKLKETGRVRDGFGLDFTLPVKHPTVAGNVAQGNSDAYAARSQTLTQGYTRAKFTMAEYFMPMSIPDRDLHQNQGEAARLNFVQSMMELNMDRFNEVIRVDWSKPENDPLAIGTDTQIMSWRTLYNKGTVNSNTYLANPKPHDAQLSISDAVWGNAIGTGTINTTIGGLNRQTNGVGAYFCCPVKNPASPETLSSDTINNAITLGTRGKDKPTLFVLTQGHYDKVLGILQAQQRFDNSNFAKASFDSFSWRGCDFIWDDDMPANNLVAINTNELELRCVSKQPTLKKSEDAERNIDVWKMAWYMAICPTLMGRGMGFRHGKVA